MTALADRRYVMTKLAAGDYLLPSNDGATIWRIRRYIDGPSAGLDWPRDLELWGIWRWARGGGLAGVVLDPDDWGQWEFVEGFLDTRRQAIERALEIDPAKL